MRVKIKGKSNIPKLTFGKTYEIVLATCSWSYHFRFTRKNYVYLIEMNESIELSRPIKTEKKYLKRMLKDSEFTKCVIEVIN